MGRVRTATPQDAAQIAAIYAPYVENTPITFEEVIPTPREMEMRIIDVLEKLPWLVFDSGGKIGGYAYASLHHRRASYRWGVDAAVYVADSFQNAGVGRALYARLFQILSELGYYRAYAGITLPNEGSTRLHRSFGFTEVGTYRDVGFKLGRWHDVMWWEKVLRPAESEPSEPLVFLPQVFFNGVADGGHPVETNHTAGPNPFQLCP